MHCICDKLCVRRLPHPMICKRYHTQIIYPIRLHGLHRRRRLHRGSAFAHGYAALDTGLVGAERGRRQTNCLLASLIEHREIILSVYDCRITRGMSTGNIALHLKARHSAFGCASLFLRFLYALHFTVYVLHIELRSFSIFCLAPEVR